MAVTFIQGLNQAEFFREAKIYRWYNFDRALEIFEKNRLTFLSPSKWDDPFEKEFLSISFSRHGEHVDIPTIPTGDPKRYKLFSQCWTGIPESEAFWSVRTPFQDGIRVSVNTENFYNFLNNYNAQFYIGKVEYMRLLDLTNAQRIIDEYVNANEDTTLFHMKLLLKKRLQYEYEKEYRIFLINHKPILKDVINIRPINPCTLIDNIKLHPKTGRYLEKHLKDYFHNSCGIDFIVEKSGFGKSTPVVINMP